ncbi:SDR family oxidoreductase [Streptomyces meridianus]|uniref:SDR family oxidoreductase n=1 Tax=Streptomyces meridianus TaxID=2938945 RepID=A0ABT0X3K7_9ACTN|nr:SDR family oxidoreductase [Streptomyces meridianus]MCM2577122.1 SDR family oxidoreductase [Streptomyces meridianus]
MTDEPATPSANRQAAPSAGSTLAGRVIAVTGAGRGIGRAVAETLARAGGLVALGDLDGAAARSAADEISRSTDGRAAGFALDVTDAASFERFLDRAEQRFGPLDVLVNNAGIMWVGPFADETEQTALRQFDVNVHGVLRGMKLAAPRMRARGAGHIVNIASAASKLAPAGEATYAAGKHAVHGYSTAVRAELRGTGVHVSVVMPGVVDTELAVGTSAGLIRRLAPQDVADTVLSVVRRPRPEVSLPRQVGLVPLVSALLPARLRPWWQRMVVPDQLAALKDPSVRAEYERGAGAGAGAEEGTAR